MVDYYQNSYFQALTAGGEKWAKEMADKIEEWERLFGATVNVVHDEVFVELPADKHEEFWAHVSSVYETRSPST